MPAWEFEIDTDGIVVTGRTASAKGKISEAGLDVPGLENHTFTLDTMQLQVLMYEEDMSNSEAAESMIVRQIRDLQRSRQPGAPDVPSPPAAIPGFNARKITGDPKAHREGIPVP